MKTKQAFDVDFIFFAMVPPNNKAKKNPQLQYRLITSRGASTSYLFSIFDSAQNDCKVEITFVSDGNQENEIRNILLHVANAKTSKAKERAAKDLTLKMYDITDQRNETGLFILIEGKKANRTRLVLCRFKRAEALYTQGKELEYLKDVFTKSSHYKLAIYEDVLSSKAFWKGYAIDRQTNAATYKAFSNFWIEKFLQSRPSINSAQGTTQFSNIVKKLLHKAPLEVQEQVISAIVNLKSRQNAQISINTFCRNYLSTDIAEKVKAQVNDDFFNSVFTIDKEILQKELSKTVLSLVDGITAFVPTFEYEQHVTEKAAKDGSKKIIIEGILKNKTINSGKKPGPKSIKPPNFRK